MCSTVLQMNVRLILRLPWSSLIRPTRLHLQLVLEVSPKSNLMQMQRLHQTTLREAHLQMMGHDDHASSSSRFC